MAGSNLDYSTHRNVGPRIAEILGYSPGTMLFKNTAKLCSKAGAPVTNTTNDNPEAKGDLCFDRTNSRVYICSAYTDTSNFTWVRIDG